MLQHRRGPIMLAATALVDENGAAADESPHAASERSDGEFDAVA